MYNVLINKHIVRIKVKVFEVEYNKKLEIDRDNKHNGKSSNEENETIMFKFPPS